jgi:O-succinylbenzoic acid--CoA ligase
VVAVVQATVASAPPTLEELRAYAAERLAPGALPRELVVLGVLPLLPSGKADKTAVRSLVAARH